ncbi:MAG: tetraacyldisaccharide 4'-kinase [Gemmatimonadota bacterium]|nr:tetraacyldisaccharide 4'-kinase [Gemmatimonadota bacterium]MDP6528932.1 tetraacyldisaccharide 4'-kinase [Gemmatimonadota bacterium]MDP6803215.1 tetraacyldisaccharide 4'-kinase [Gemmatimonadota bacterium]MDP7032428.1 tetraacyldisaccharide 4'-kinase [Gemmatimonadota bacterium]
MKHPVMDHRGLRRVGGHWPPGLARGVSFVYGMASGAFHKLHDHRLLPCREVPIPVVSVGALSVGGSGKTPVVRWLAGELLARGELPGVVLRGYRSEGGKQARRVDPGHPDVQRDGDEAVLLAIGLPGVPVIVSPLRREGVARLASAGTRVALLDDGFQHRCLRRDVDMVLWDLRAERSPRRLIPAGSLRERPKALTRASALVLVNRGDGFPDVPPEWPGAGPVFRVALESRVVGMLPASAPLHAVSGVAVPESFEESLIRSGVALTGASRWADHHAFTHSDVQAVSRQVRVEGAEGIAMTAKDAVRWPGGGGLPAPVVFDLSVHAEGGDALVEWVVARIREAGND